MEEVFKSSPDLLEILQQEKDFEDVINITTDKQTSLEKKKD